MGRRRKLEFRVAGRYGYHAVDVYDAKTHSLLATAVAGITKKEAFIVADAMRDVQGTRYQRLAKSIIAMKKRQALKKVM